MKKIAKVKSQDSECFKCGGTKLKGKITTFPFTTPFGKTINVSKVPVNECLACHELIPNKKGREKLARCLDAMFSLNF
jgi:YgiT-type zinc finger domain-containing protein